MYQHIYEFLRRAAHMSCDAMTSSAQAFKGGSQASYKGDGVIRWCGARACDHGTISLNPTPNPILYPLLHARFEYWL
jgi:hypothetical protein